MGSDGSLLDGYTVHFPQLFINEEFKADFLKFLKINLNDEGMLFCLAAKQFLSLPTEKLQVAKLLEIVDQFIKISAKRELNIPCDVRTEVLKKIEESKQREKPTTMVAPKTILDKMYKLVYKELKEDAFPRYIRSPRFFNLIDEKGTGFLHQIATNTSLLEPGVIKLQPTDFKSDRLIDRDIEFALKMYEDSPDWMALNKSSNKLGPRSFISNRNYCIGQMDNELKLCKITGTVPFNIEHTVKTFFTSAAQKYHDKNVIQMEVLKSGLNDWYHTIPSLLMRATLDVGPLLHPRELVYLATLVYDSERECYIHVGKSTEAFDILPQANVVRSHCFIGFIFDPVNDNLTRYTQVFYTDFKFKMASDMSFKGFVKGRAKQLHEGISEACKLSAEEKLEIQKDDDVKAIYEVANDFKERYLNDSAIKTWTVL
jgi:hypothetical protein